jgi:NADPH:quinone reductase
MPGGLAEVAATLPFMTLPIPDDMSFETAAGMVSNHQTAHLALGRRGRLAPGETVLVHGASGGVGTAAIQVAQASGAGTVLAVSSSPGGRSFALAQGADHALHGDGDWVAEVRELTRGRGADVVVDTVGGDAFDSSLRCMAPLGRVLVVGFVGGRIPEVKVNRLLLCSLDVIGINFGGLLEHDRVFPAAAHADLMRWWAQGSVRPVPGPVYALADGAQALRDLGARAIHGKPVIRVRESTATP